MNREKFMKHEQHEPIQQEKNVKDQIPHTKTPLNAISEVDFIIKMKSFKDLSNGWKIQYHNDAKNYFSLKPTQANNIIGIFGRDINDNSAFLKKLDNLNQFSVNNYDPNGINISRSQSMDKIFFYHHFYHLPPIKYESNSIEQEDFQSNYNEIQIRNRFICNLIIKRATIIIIIIKELSLDDQQYIHSIRQKTDKRIIVIHDLKFYSSNEIVIYVKEIIKQSLYKVTEQTINDNEKYYDEECIDCHMKPSKITHLIMIMNVESNKRIENTSAVTFIKKVISQSNTVDFSPLSDLMYYFGKISKSIFIEPINNIESIASDNDQIIKHLQISQSRKEINLRKTTEKSLEILDNYIYAQMKIIK